MPDIELPKPEELEEIRNKTFTREVALTTAIFAVLLAITSLGGNNATKDMMLAQQQASDQWAFYQSKTMREHLYKTNAIQIESLLIERGSVMNAAALRRSLQAQQRQWPVFFLLNNFDSRNALHRRMRERLAAEAGRALLPFAVSKADELCEALSEQKTVLEFAPDAAVCGDFMRLAHWACNYFTSRDSRDREVA